MMNFYGGLKGENPVEKVFGCVWQTLIWVDQQWNDHIQFITGIKIKIDHLKEGVQAWWSSLPVKEEVGYDARNWVYETFLENQWV